jgi:rSAM/selenodomain-associated transferase 2
MPATISIIIPALNEAAVLDRTLSVIACLPHEIILVDGGSQDRTQEIAGKYGIEILTSRQGRGLQLDEGARKAKGDILLFLHADTLLPFNFDRLIRAAMERQRVVLGAFRLGFVPSNAWLRLIAHVANVRSRFLKLPYGDQALFMRRSDYFRAGRFKDLPVMEDVDLLRRVRHMGLVVLVKGRVMTSSRRWKKEGFLRATLRNWSLMLRYLFGASPHLLRRQYADVR